MTYPKISIVTPSFNQGEFLGQCIQSVLDQGYPNLEYFIIDGGSTDNSLDVIKKYKKYLTYWCSKPDDGQSDAINIGFRKAKGDLVAWLNSDDFYQSGALFQVASVYKENPFASFYFGNGHRVSKDGIKKSEFYPNGTVCFDLHSFVFGLNYILQPAAFINHEVLEQIAIFNRDCSIPVKNYLDPNLQWGMDSDLWARLAKKAPPFALPDFLASSREYGATKTSIGSFKRIEELRLIAEQYSGQPYTPGVLLYFLDTLHQFVGDSSSFFPSSFKKDIEKFWLSTSSLMESLGVGPDGMPLQTISSRPLDLKTPQTEKDK